MLQNGVEIGVLFFSFISCCMHVIGKDIKNKFEQIWNLFLMAPVLRYIIRFIVLKPLI
jgi:hypothetical protein